MSLKIDLKALNNGNFNFKTSFCIWAWAQPLFTPIKALTELNCLRISPSRPTTGAEPAANPD